MRVLNQRVLGVMNPVHLKDVSIIKTLVKQCSKCSIYHIFDTSKAMNTSLVMICLKKQFKS